MHTLESKEKQMLDKTSWIRVNKQCHTLVDDDYKILATISTPYNETDGDENLIWEVELKDEEFGSYVSLYCAKIAVQRSIAVLDARIEAATQKKNKVKNKKRKEIGKKSVVRK